MAIRYPSSVKIKTTAEDIEHGYKNDCFRCPLAIAGKRAIEEAIGRRMPTGHRFSVTKEDIEIYRLGKRDGVRFWFTLQVYKMKSVGSQFICEFDGEHPVRPFTMTLKAVPGKAGQSYVG